MTSAPTTETRTEKKPAQGTKLPPGPPKPQGWLGRVRMYLSFFLDPFGLVGGRFAQYGDVYYVHPRKPGPGLFVLRHPDHFEQVLITDARKVTKTHSAFAHLSEILGDGLLTTDGEVWRRQRRLVQPAFSRARLVEYATAMGEEAAAEADRWRDGEVRDVSVAMTEMTLRIVCRTLFGHDARGDASAVRSSMHTFQNSLIALELPIPRWASPASRRLRRARATLDSIIYGMIAARREHPSEAKDLLQMLLEAVDEEGDGGGLSELEIRDQVVTLFLAGHETTANALTWTFHLLSQHPLVEARLHEEVDRVLGGRPATYDDVARLPYAEQVFLEAMRLYPPVYMLARQAAEDMSIGGYDVPAGSELVLWVWHAHHDPRFWDEPWAFRPERFEKARSNGRPKSAYLPFGGGPRACIGKTFAQIEGQLALATLASRHRLEAIEGHSVELRPRVTLAPAGGLPMKVRAR
jgi:cytochrome P450